MSLAIDHNKRRLSLKAAPGWSGTEISRSTAQLILSQPEMASYDFVLDLRDSDTGSTLDDFKIVLDAYNRVTRQPGPKYGCYVSLNPSYPLWAAAMADLFGDRTCLVFTTPEQAHAFLDDEREAVRAG